MSRLTITALIAGVLALTAATVNFAIADDNKAAPTAPTTPVTEPAQPAPAAPTGDELVKAATVQAPTTTAPVTTVKPKPTQRPEGVPASLKIGIEDGYFPYEYLDQAGKFTGFDVEVIDYVCKDLMVECTLDRGAFDSLIPNLIYKKTDLVISALSVTDERKKRVAFSDTYVPPAYAVFLVPTNSKITDVNQIKNLGVQQGTTLATYLEKETNYKVNYYPSFDLSMLDLLAGSRVDAVFESYDVAAKYLKEKADQIKILGEPVLNPTISQGTAIALRPADNTLRQAVNQALARAEADGTLPALRAKYGLDRK